MMKLHVGIEVANEEIDNGSGRQSNNDNDQTWVVCVFTF